MLGIMFYESAEAEPFVEFHYQPPHPVHAAEEERLPVAELRGGGIPLGKPFADGVRRKLAGLEGEQHAGGIERVEKAESVANEDPAVAGGLLGAVGVFLGGEKLRAAFAERD